MKEYEYNGSTYLFADGHVPAGAVEVKAQMKPTTKQVTPKNKANDAARPADSK